MAPDDTHRRGRERWQAAVRRVARARRRLHHAVRHRGRAGLRPAPTSRPYPGFERIGWPGEFPFTRGLYATGYRGRTWTIRQFAGFGNAAADQRALQDDPRPRRRRAVGRLRHADADGPRLRRPARRSARSATAASRSTRPPTWTCCSTASRSSDVTTSMTISRAGRAGVLHVPRRRRAAGRRHLASSTARCRPTSSRSTSRRRSGCSRPSRTCA